MPKKKERTEGEKKRRQGTGVASDGWLVGAVKSGLPWRPRLFRTGRRQSANKPYYDEANLLWTSEKKRVSGSQIVRKAGPLSREKGTQLFRYRSTVEKTVPRVNACLRRDSRTLRRRGKNGTEKGQKEECFRESDAACS